MRTIPLARRSLACILGELVNSVDEDVPDGQTVDLGRVARMALVHDLAESIVTDLPRQAAEVIGREAKHAAERSALEIILDGDDGHGLLRRSLARI